MPERRIFFFACWSLFSCTTSSDRCIIEYGMAKVSVIVTTQMAFFPACQGVSVKPSGRFPSERDRPAGSLIEEMPARLRAWKIRSLRKLCRTDLPELRLQDKSCEPLQSTSEPHVQSCGSHNLDPRRRLLYVVPPHQDANRRTK